MVLKEAENEIKKKMQIKHIKIFEKLMFVFFKKIYFDYLTCNFESRSAWCVSFQL